MFLSIQYIIGFLLIFVSFSFANIPKLPHCFNKNKEGLVLVNTLDGKLSVLNHGNGNEVWSIPTGPGPMLSSNIDRLELTNNGHWVRIIPSLHGNLYKFNGDTIDPIPLTADNLLTSSFQYSDDLVIVGGKEIRTYGLTLSNGNLVYECNLSGCMNRSKSTDEDLILIERNTHIVRAVESRYGVERWNFSVGQMSIRLPQISCHSEISGANIPFDLKTVVSEGLIYAFGEKQNILWKQKFDTPIVNVWTWDGHNLKSVNLFTNTQYSWGNTEIHRDLAPALYVGMHQKQLYVQESLSMRDFMRTNHPPNDGDITEIRSMSQIPWMPYPASSSALMVIDNEKRQNEDGEEGNELMDVSVTAISVLYGSEYINGNGFYLYPKDPQASCEDNKTIVTIDEEADVLDSEEETPIQVMIISLWYWWKEVTVIAISTAFLVNLLITLFKKYQNPSNYIVVERHLPMKITETFNRTNSESSGDKEFVSRYLTDFKPVQCLGKGGFGIVFEAQNKIDDCKYAVKRITLPNKKQSRERVMREVKTLAKLEHRNIVRYFNAWLETPPADWIMNFDHEWKKDVLSTDGYDYTSATTATPMKGSSSVVIDIPNKLGYNSSDLRKRDVDSDSFIVFENDTEKEYSYTTDEKSAQSCEDSAISETSVADCKNSINKLPITDSNTIFLYIQMQLCRKESLKDWLKDNLCRNTEMTLDMFSQIVSAVEYVHKNNLIHRDLKPSNIFFSIHGQIKVGDFGLVTASEECSSEEFEDDGGSMRHTKAVGTQLYMSPEQLNGLNYNYKVDVYSLGVILFELLMPFHTTMERNKTLLDLRKNEFPTKFCQVFHKEHQLVSKMLSENPDDRPTSLEILSKLPLINTEDINGRYKKNK